MNLTGPFKYSLGLFVAFALGYGVSRYLTPENVKFVDRVKTVESKNVKTVVVTKEMPNGVKITRSETLDLSKVNTQTETIKEIIKNPPSWAIAATVGVPFGKIKPVYGGQVIHRLLGPISAGFYANTQGGGVVASFEF